MKIRQFFSLIVAPVVLQVCVLPHVIGQMKPERSIQVDYQGLSQALTETPNLCVGAGRANEGLRADWQQQLAETQRDCGFRYLRFHGLLCDDMGVYKVNARGEEVYQLAVCLMRSLMLCSRGTSDPLWSWASCPRAWRVDPIRFSGGGAM